MRMYLSSYLPTYLSTSTWEAVFHPCTIYDINDRVPYFLRFTQMFTLEGVTQCHATNCWIIYYYNKNKNH